jgi:hypothetical protein
MPADTIKGGRHHYVVIAGLNRVIQLSLPFTQLLLSAVKLFKEK